MKVNNVSISNVPAVQNNVASKESAAGTFDSVLPVNVGAVPRTDPKSESMYSSAVNRRFGFEFELIGVFKSVAR